MKFACPNCAQHLEAEDDTAGMRIACPACTSELVVPRPHRFTVEKIHFACTWCGQNLAILREHSGGHVTCPSCARVILVPWEEQQLLSATALSDIHTSLQHEEYQRSLSELLGAGFVTQEVGGGDETGDVVSDGQRCGRYLIGKPVARGGMGVILTAKDLNVRRRVAMKVMLSADNAPNESKLRFVEEAQITGQLEHPGIVPVYELGADRKGRVFYTMKYLSGVTLKHLLRDLRRDEPDAIRNWPLARLLTVFQKICDTMAFAHSRGVIHRDLKPDNIMIGEYGEVVILDWGLAKVVGRSRAAGAGPAAGPAPGSPLPEIESVRDRDGQASFETLAGGIMGTPGFMAPEQACGDNANLDERTDVYALGAILYNILCLQVPVRGATIEERLTKILAGTIPDPREYNRAAAYFEENPLPGRRTRPNRFIPLRHCPAGRVPDSLSAVAMKSLHVNPAARYPSVRALQAEIEAYQGGFATKAESANAWLQLRKLVARHKVLAGAAVLLLLVLVASSMALYRQREVAESARRVAVAEQRTASLALQTLRGVEPVLMEQVDFFQREADFPRALETMRYVLTLAPEKVDHVLREGYLLQACLRFGEAERVYARALRLDPTNTVARHGLDVCRRLEPVARQNGEMALWQLQDALREQGRPAEAEPVLKALEGRLRERLRHVRLAPGGLAVDPATGGIAGDFSGTGLRDVQPLAGLPFTALNFSGCRLLADIRGLRDMPLRELDLTGCAALQDISVLLGMSLERLSLAESGVTDTRVLEQIHVQNLRR